MKNRQMKNNKGSISLYVLIAMIFFLIFSITIFVGISNSRRTQLQSHARIKELYEKDISNLEEVYEKRLGGPISLDITQEEIPLSLDLTGPSIKEIREGVPVPIGFYYVGGTIGTGLVISDSVSDENRGVEYSKLASFAGNQFVWVPVIVKKVVITATTENVSHLKWAKGNQNKAYFATNGTEFKNSFETTSNGTYTIYGVNSSGGEEIKTIEVSSLMFTRDTFGANNTLGEVTATTTYWDDKTTTEYIKMEESVKKYGGFYIGRYETCYGSGTTATNYIPQSKRSITAVTTTWANTLGRVWNLVTQQNAITIASNLYKSNTYVTSFLPWGINWDTTLRWLIVSDDKTNEEIANSTSWGNYSNDTFSATTGIGFSGLWSQTVANNIYDLAGNLREFTQERYEGSTSRVVRAGSYNQSGATVPARTRETITATTTNANAGFRVCMYIE